jgi:hypothetical protein
LQLFIDGAIYDTESETWITESQSFDIYVVSADEYREDVIVSLALRPTDIPADADVSFGGNDIDLLDWEFGYAPIDNLPNEWNPGGDLPRHGVYPTWFTELNTGDFDLSTSVGDVQPDEFGNFWNPASGDGEATHQGQIKMFHVETDGIYTSLHFDAYTLNDDGSVDVFAPFSHDAQANYVPEPGTIAMMGTGMFGVGLAAFRRKKDKK